MGAKTPTSPSAGSVTGPFNVATAARVSGLTKHMVNYLCRAGLVIPTGSTRRGRGLRRDYTYTDLLLLRVVSKLLKQGISVLRLKKKLKALQARGHDADELISKRFVVTDGYNVFFENEGTLELIESGQMAFAFVLELGSIRKEVRAKISQRRAAG